ncbi:MAG: thioesterase family protein [Deltaproteobacteria bacterium]|nr:thioesterase family protein [Deltaproteobacteria bacterium]MBW2419576.1 thioesterase family protein [Deltaproteobacteria bacterium]
MRYFEYRHIVGFEETNVVGNVYYANHIRWQGRCRELFLRETVPEILEEFDHGLALVTLSVNCDYYHELGAFDELALRMSLADLSHHRMTLRFEYWRLSEGKAKGGKAEAKGESGEVLVARGQQELGCMGRRDGKFEPRAWPASLLEALRPYAGS